MTVIKKEDFSRQFNSTVLLKQKEKEVKRWQWIILLCCFLFQMLPYCVALNLTNVLLPSDWTVWTGGDQVVTSVTFTMGALGAAVAGPFIAKIFGKQINMRIVYIVGVVLAMIGFFGSAINAFTPVSAIGTKNLGGVAAILYISNIISQIGVMVFSGLGVNNLISQWWPPEKRGMALGIAFAGGSIGNIWMQQLLGVLTKKFGNVNNLQAIGDVNGNIFYDQVSLVNGDRWITYLILAVMGAITGVAIALVACRRRVPPTEIFGIDGNKTQDTQIVCVECSTKFTLTSKQAAVALEASPLVTQKYPPYWILAVGYLVLQMGTVHAAMNGLIIASATVPATGANYADVMSTGGTLFGVACLVGNSLGGIINDRLGPNKSIALAGVIQCGAILCLMASVKGVALAYVYFILAGLSVYIYTSTPAFLSGRLYGAKQSNNQMAILGMFIAVGFAISNSVSGAITGVTTKTNIHYMFGEKTFGNMFALGLFSLISMAVGTIIVVICSSIIMRKGIKGLLEYSPTKYTTTLMKYSFMNWFTSLKIWFKGYDYRIDDDKLKAKNEAKLATDLNYNSLSVFNKALEPVYVKEDLNPNEKQVLLNVYFNKYSTTQILNKETDMSVAIESLVAKGLLKETILTQQTKLYSITNKVLSNVKQEDLNNKITIQREQIDHILEKLDTKRDAKIAKINEKLTAAQKIEIDTAKQDAINLKVDQKLAALQQKRDNIASRLPQMTDWKAYKTEYHFIETKDRLLKLKTKLEDEKAAKIKTLQTKIGIAKFIANYNKIKQVEGNALLLDLYNNPVKHNEQVVDKMIQDNIDRKVAAIKGVVSKKQSKYTKIVNKEASIFNK